MRDASDSDIWAYAMAQTAIVVTKDEDFAIRRHQATGAQVLWLRFGNATNRVLGARLEAIWPTVEHWLEQGEAIVEA